MLHHHLIKALRTPGPLVDRNGVVIGVLVGRPDDAGWDKVMCDAAEALETSRLLGCFSAKEKAHKRGRFPALPAGISHGGGQRKPGNFVHSQPNKGILDELVAHPAFIRLASFASGNALPPVTHIAYRFWQVPFTHGLRNFTDTTHLILQTS